MRIAFVLWFLFTPTWAFAHSSSDAFIRIVDGADETSVSVSISLLDLHRRFGVDDNRDRRVTWGELKSNEPRVRDYLDRRFNVSVSSGSCQLTPKSLGIDRLADGNYAKFDYRLVCPYGPLLPLNVDYLGFFEVDAQHRGLVSFESELTRIAGVISAERTSISIASEGADTGSLRRFTIEGIEHIFSGYDHMLFILCLILPAVYLRRDGRWIAQENFRSTGYEVVKALTAFTLSHSLTLALSAFSLLPELPRNLVETGIALSILFTALNNIFLWVDGRQVLIAFLFGLVHGIGFSSVLNDLGLDGLGLFWALLGFNLGVELAQLIIVLIVLPINFVFRHSREFRRMTFVGGSLLTALFALLWAIERIFEVNIL